MVRPGRGGEIFPCETKIYANITVLHYQRIKGESAVTQNTALRLGDIQGAVRVSEDSREEGVGAEDAVFVPLESVVVIVAHDPTATYRERIEVRDFTRLIGGPDGPGPSPLTSSG